MPAKDHTTSAVYAIRCTVNHKVYVGSAANIGARWKAHRRALESGFHHSDHLQRAWDLYGKEQFVFEVIEFVLDPSELIVIEQEWIDRLQSADRNSGYNVSPTAGSPRGVKHSPDARLRMSLAHLGKKLSAKTCDKMSMANKGKKLTAEHRAKISAAHKGRKKTREHTAKMAAAHRGLKPSMETRAKMSAAQTGRRCPSETRRKISESHKGKIHGPTARAKMSLARRHWIESHKESDDELP
jgi:group I intron endonuclease